MSTERTREKKRAGRRISALLVGSFALIAFASGCASVETTGLARLAPDSVPLPDRILVHDVAVTLADLPAGSAIHAVAESPDEQPSPEQVQLGQELGEQIGRKIAEELTALGLPARRVSRAGGTEQVGDVVVRSAFVTVDKGSRVVRVLVGFGAGAGELTTHFEVYQVTPTGREPFGNARIQAAGGYVPGVLLSMGIGGIVKGAAIGGGLAAGREFTSESIQGAAERTAEEFIETIKPGLVERGWIEEG